MSRRILHHGFNPASTPVEISERAVAGCWFEWNRQGGCGAGELRLRDDFSDRDGIEPGDWISMESEPGLRWYLGRVETREAAFPAGVRLRLEGMGVELGEVYPGGFGTDVDGASPQRLGGTDLFSLDPDRDAETFDATGDAASVVRLLMTRYVVPASHISYHPTLVEDAERSAAVDSLKVRGEETARSLIKDLAVRAGAAAWGVDAAGAFFFLQRRPEAVLTLQLGQNVAKLEELSDRELLFNRVLLTGDYIYDRQEASDHIAVRSFRWRGNFVEPSSRAAHGERRLRMWIPWIRTQADSVAFVREFFRVYSQPHRRYRVTTGELTAPVLPWLGRIRLNDVGGNEIATGVCDVIRVTFDRVARMQLEIGPEDPRNLWPEPTQDERWELPARHQVRGGIVSLTSLDDVPSGGGGDSTGDSTGTTDATDSLSLEPTSSTSGGTDVSDTSDDASDGSSGSSSELTTSLLTEESSSGETGSDDSTASTVDSSDASSSDGSSGSDVSSSLAESDPWSSGDSAGSSSANLSSDDSDDGSSDDDSDAEGSSAADSSGQPGSSGEGSLDDNSSGWNSSDDDSSAAEFSDASTVGSSNDDSDVTV